MDNFSLSFFLNIISSLGHSLSYLKARIIQGQYLSIRRISQGFVINLEAEKEEEKIPWKKGGLIWPSMTFEVIFHFMKELRLHDAHNHRNLYQNQLLNHNMHSPVVFLWDVKEFMF